jgi:uncharacterized protein (TIGR02231 family)
MTPFSSHIVEVVVFPDRARVTRRGSITLEAGLHRVEFADLPLAVQTDSLRAAGRGTAAARLLGVEARHVFFSETPAETIRELEKQLEALQQQDRIFFDQQGAAEVRLSFAKNLADKATEQLARGLAFGRSDIAQSGTLIDFVQQQIDRAQAAVRDVQQQRRELARQIEKVTNELNQQRAARPRERLLAVVEIDVQQPGDLTLDLTYVIGNASWSALYDVRVSEASGPRLALTYLGQVTQRTGEDWIDVALTLSTARPALTTVQPELSPWYLNVFTPPPAPQPRAAAAPAAMRSAAKAEALDDVASGALPAPAMLEMEPLTAQVAAEGASVTFQLAEKVSIPSDGSPHKLTVTTIDLTPAFDYLCVPKVADAVYRRAQLINHSEFLLLDGPASLFVEGDFAGTLPLKRIAPREEFELALGVDDRVTVKRELKARDVDKKLIGDRRRLRAAYEIEVKNWRTGPIDLEVRDQFPVTRHEQVKVKLESCEPKPIEQSELGELKWRVTIAPQAAQTIRFEFSIEQPVNLTVTGLP